VSKPKKLTFLTFSVYRIVLFCGCLGIIIFAWAFGPMLWRFYVGTGNAFHYQGGTLAVHYLDVGQGDAVVIQFPDGRVCMIDSGTEFYYTRIKTYLTTRILKDGNDKIDFLIATHSHDDHIGGFPQLLADFDVDVVYRPHNKALEEPGEAIGQVANTVIYQKFIDAVYTYANEIRFIIAGEKIAGAEFLMYFHTPAVVPTGTLYSDFDDISPIISLRHKNKCFIFTGDAGFKTEDQFRSCAVAGAIDFANLEVYLKVGHHGSKNSTSAAFLTFLKPNCAIISVGARNTYGHPNPDTMKRLEDTGLRTDNIFETRTLGNVVFAKDNTTDRMFFAFDNEVDLSFVYVLSAAVLFFISFTDFRVVKQIF
jgi:competence protein ComEC